MEEPPRIRRDGFQIAALSFRVERPEGQRRLPGSGYAGEHHQRIPGDIERDVLQIVLAGPADANEAAVSFRQLVFSAYQLIHHTVLDRAQSGGGSP